MVYRTTKSMRGPLYNPTLTSSLSLLQGTFPLNTPTIRINTSKTNTHLMFQLKELASGCYCVVNLEVTRIITHPWPVPQECFEAFFHRSGWQYQINLSKNFEMRTNTLTLRCSGGCVPKKRTIYGHINLLSSSKDAINGEHWGLLLRREDNCKNRLQLRSCTFSGKYFVFLILIKSLPFLDVHICATLCTLSVSQMMNNILSHMTCCTLVP